MAQRHRTHRTALYPPHRQRGRPLSLHARPNRGCPSSPLLAAVPARAGTEPPRPVKGSTTLPSPPKQRPCTAELSRAGRSPAPREGPARDGAIQRRHPRGSAPTDLVEAALGREDGDVAVEAGTGASRHGGSGSVTAEGLSACGTPPLPQRAAAGALPGHGRRAGARGLPAPAQSRFIPTTAHARTARRPSASRLPSGERAQ